MSQRFNYRYALFSTSGFADEASGLALAHQISLIDLSGPDFADLRRLVRSLADALFEIGRDVERPVRAMRMLVRRELGTWPDGFGRGLYENHASRGLLDGSVERLFGELRSLGELFIVWQTVRSSFYCRPVIRSALSIECDNDKATLSRFTGAIGNDPGGREWKSSRVTWCS
jgi:hypothetical protein